VEAGQVGARWRYQDSLDGTLTGRNDGMCQYKT